MYKIKKLRYQVLLILALIAFAILNFILAYFSDKANVDNVFTIGSVQIQLLQPLLDLSGDLNDNGIPDVAENIKPCDIIVEDPQVKNTGANDAYIYIVITVPAAEVVLDDIDSTEESVFTELFEYEINPSWEEITNAKIERQDSVTHIFCYKNDQTNDILRPKQTTEPLYSSVKFVNLRDADSVDEDQTITVQAYALQVEGLPENTTVETTELVLMWIEEAQSYEQNNMQDEGSL